MGWFFVYNWNSGREAGLDEILDKMIWEAESLDYNLSNMVNETEASKTSRNNTQHSAYIFTTEEVLV